MTWKVEASREMMWKVHSWLFNFMCSIDSAVQFWSNQCIVVPDTPGPGCSGSAPQEFCLLLSGGSLSSLGEGYRGACSILLRPTVYIDTFDFPKKRGNFAFKKIA